MRIHDYASKIVEGRARVSATVTWEECDWSEREIFFETDDRFSNDLNANPNAFLLAAIIPAMQFGERRVLIEGHVCPQLRDGLDVVMQQLRKWYGNLQSFDRAKERFTIFARDSDVVLIPIYTKIRFLEENAPCCYYTSLFVKQSFGACLAATAQALSHRITSLLIPSSHDVNDLEPIGSHPLIEPIPDSQPYGLAQSIRIPQGCPAEDLTTDVSIEANAYNP